jgi:hypothetical protein
MPTQHRKLTQAELQAEAKERFGDDPLDIAFACPACGDVARIRDFPEGARERAGQECIGRSLGALEGPPTNDGGRSKAKRGCDWAAYGFIRGPWEIEMPDGRSAWGFPLADVVTTAQDGGEV